ncbi:uncharacterized protein RCC_08879 [Ramularia collo-cygni]|uniref:Uncharacterized protein n=1 Tax=Ramularia collo-cygni TaxID=112498 RepID=A0A2D3VIS9_9PEZI|nr:uncharacterized protein RCC_08879 [Ramularia collo-cygni]CZT23169.1 uncharacterized protein RCC_08879 [Ramularia collo-cygni]
MLFKREAETKTSTKTSANLVGRQRASKSPPRCVSNLALSEDDSPEEHGGDPDFQAGEQRVPHPGQDSVESSLSAKSQNFYDTNYDALRPLASYRLLHQPCRLAASSIGGHLRRGPQRDTPSVPQDTRREAHRATASEAIRK